METNISYKTAYLPLFLMMTEWNRDDALAVRFEEGWNGGLEKGIEETALKTLAEDAIIEFVQKITGLDIEKIEKLKAG